jgi:8-oxo-dGTP pyrophosphatase MutT (NUDIX family)
MELYGDIYGKTIEKPNDITATRRLSAYAITEHEDTVLVVRPNWTTQLELPGGEIEAEEFITEGLTRELQEETGYSITIGDVFYANETKFYYKETFFNCLNFWYLASLQHLEPDDSVMIPGEIDETLFIKKTDLNPNDFHHHGKKVIKRYLST